MTPAERTHCVTAAAARLGFHLCGVAPAVEFPELARLPEWLERGYAGQMSYLADPRRASPARVLEGARSLIVCALLYNSERPLSTEWTASQAPLQHQPRRGWISRYAWGDDYHAVLGERLERLVAALRAEFPEPFEARPYVDTGPVAERIAAKYAGLGWLGKNTCLIHPGLGSWLFLGVIVTTLELAPSLGPDDSPQPDLCGQCTLCLEACPTGAFVAPYLMDARRCISYLTIEHRGTLPEELRPAMGAHVFGCDICQDVCPFNRKAPVTNIAEFSPRQFPRKGENRNSKIENRPESRSADMPPVPGELFAPPLEWLAALSDEEYRRTFRGSAVKRAKYRGLVRNACVALGNAAGRLDHASRERVRALLQHLAASADPVIAEHAAWALARIEAQRLAPLY
jgi:epoxyqueuosine reductase